MADASDVRKARRKCADSLLKAIQRREDLTLSEKAIATVLLQYLNFGSGQCNPSTETIMRDYALSHTAAVKGLGELLLKRVITKRSGKGVTSNRYFFPELKSEDWSQSAEIRPTESVPQQAEIRPTGGSSVQAVLRPTSRPHFDQDEIRSPVGRISAPNTGRNLNPSHEEELGEVISPPRAHAHTHTREGGR